MNRFTCLIVGLALLLPGVALADQTLIRGITVIDIETGELRKAQNILIDGDTIRNVDAAVAAAADDVDTVVDGKGLFVVPGLTEMHAHVQSEQPGRDWALTLYVINGITTARGMLGQPEHLQLRGDIERQKIIGPRLITSGPSQNGTSVTTLEQAEASVREQKQAGYDFLKIHPGMSDASFTRLADTAREVGIPFGGHITAESGLMRSLELGQKSVDHLDGFLTEWARLSGVADVSNTGFFGSVFVDQLDDAKMATLVAQVKPYDFAVVPTESLMAQILSPNTAEQMAQMPGMDLVPQELLDNWSKGRGQYLQQLGLNAEQAERFLAARRNLTKALLDAGVPIALGSDAPQIYQVPGYSLHHELELMVQAGLTPLQALQAGSLVPANYFGKSGQWGKISSGFAADLLLLRSNPLEDISHSRDIHSVFIRGRWLSPEWIREQKQALRRP